MLTDMDELGASSYVVLGMLGLGPKSGYEIKRAVELSIRFFWTISQAQIYPALEQLEAAALVRGWDEPRGRRPRRVYEITPSGRSVLRTWLRRPEPMPFELRDIGMVKLFFADALDRDGALELLESVRSRSDERVRELQTIEPAARAAADGGDLYPLLTLEMGLAFHQAMVDACEAFATRLSAPASTGSR
jgi:DNA-binding PadR family transcriptional regulator